MAFVLDSSVAAVWALADEESSLADFVAERLKDEIAIVPSIWWYEVRNLLVVNERRNRLTASESALFIALLSSYPIQIEPIANEQIALQFARQHKLSFYDAAHLATAHRHNVPLATLDEALKTAADAVGIPLLS